MQISVEWQKADQQLSRKEKERRRGEARGKLLGVMDTFSVLIVEMVSWRYIYICTHTHIHALLKLCTLFYLFIWLHLVAYGDLSSRTRDWTWATAVKALSPNHWTAREFPQTVYLKYVQFIVNNTSIKVFFFSKQHTYLDLSRAREDVDFSG